MILDLSAPNLDIGAAVARLREARPGLALTAYAPHVHEERLREAAAAGCDEVLTRGQFNARMDEVLARYAQPR